MMYHMQVNLKAVTKGEIGMLSYDGHGSEVTRLLSQITAEYEAAQRGLTGLACGIAQHEFISARMENMGHLHCELQTIVGDSAMALIVDALDHVD